MDERNDIDDNEMDEILMLPGFRFHPTDEELVGFYLRRKIQKRPPYIELIKQLDIYQYEPWDLPKLATTGEKEWYFYCPRDRKYRNSARPNRVTGAGFWKATGTDRPIYSSSSSQGSRCIGLKKSLVFYKGRAAEGIKTDWMMHEFRLPSFANSQSHKRFMDKNIPANDSWAICRIFKKTNSSTQRVISHSWLISPLPETTTSDILTQVSHTTQFSSAVQFGCDNDLQQSSITNFSPPNFPSHKTINQGTKPSEHHHHQLPNVSTVDLPTSYTFSSVENPGLNMSSSMFGDFDRASNSIDFSGLQEQCNGFSMISSFPQEILQGHASYGDQETGLIKDPNVLQFYDQCGTIRTVGIPFTFPLTMQDSWKLNSLWDSSHCPNELFATY